MRFRHRIWLLPAMMAVIVSAGIAINSRITTRASEALERVQDVQYPSVEAFRSLKADFTSIQDSLQQAVTEGDPAQLTAAAEHAASARANLAQLAKLEGADARASGRLKTLFEEYYSAATLTTGILLGSEEGDPSRAVARMQAANQVLATQLDGDSAKAMNDFRGLLSGSADDVHRTLTVSMVTALIMLAALGAGSWMLIKQIFASLGGEPEEAVNIVRRIADGDFTTEVVTRPGDTRSLLHGIAALKAKLGTLILDIHDASVAVDHAAEEMNQSIGHLSERTAGQAASLEETATSMEEMTATVRQSADSSQHATELARDARKQAQAGGAVVERAVQAMSQINASSEKIADIIGVIDEIAFQTNLLALNAAVEAARAGDQGRGFAVVASEVRNLAQRSSSAAREIKDLIEDSVAKVQDGQTLVNESGSHLTGIVESVKRVADIISEISTASQEQSAGLQQVSVAITQMDQMTQDNASMVDDVNGVARAMADQARDLTAIVGRFRIDERQTAAAQPRQQQPGRAAAATPKDHGTTWQQHVA